MLRKIFGKKPAEAALVSPQHADDPDARIELTMEEVGRYAHALALRRGYPADTAEMIARRVVFLERRGIIGFVALVREILLHNEEWLPGRLGGRTRDNQEGPWCPFGFGVAIEPQLPELASRAPDHWGWLEPPSESILLIAKIAEWAAPTGRIVSMAWAIDKEIIAEALVEGYRVGFFGDQLAIRGAERLGLCGFEPTGDMPKLYSGLHDSISLPQKDIWLIERYLGEGR